MKTIDKYLLREMIVPFLIGTVSVVLMFQANTYMGLAKQLDLRNVPFSAVIQVLYYQTPFDLSMTLPLGMALASSLAMTRIVRESELTAFRAAGCRILRVLAPIAFFGVAVSALHFYDVEVLMPPAQRKANDIQGKVWGLGVSPTFVANKTINLGRFAASLGTVQRGAASGDMDIDSVMLIERPDPQTIALTTAKSATYRDGVWTFRGAYYFNIKGEDLVIARPAKDFVINERIPLDDMFRSPMPEEQTIGDLQDEIRNAGITGINAHAARLELYNKFTLPASCLVFSFVSPIFSILFARNGGFIGVLLSLAMALLYYNVYVIATQIVGKIEAIPPLMAACFPDAVFLLFGLWAVRRLE